MIKGKKVDTFYIFHDSTVTNDVVVSMSEDPDLDTTRLWYNQLGHMSERGLHLLSKQGLLCGQKIGKLDFCEYCIFGKQHRVSFCTMFTKLKTP